MSGRAGTLREAIQEHCSTGQNVGQGSAACTRFNDEPEAAKDAIEAFLMNQVFRPDPLPPPEEEE